MNDNKLPKTHPMSFRHRIKDGASHYIDSEHFMGIDPLDHARFHEIYKQEEEEQSKSKKSKN